MFRKRSLTDNRPPFNHRLAKKLIGKHLIIGLTYLADDKTIEKQEQLHGIVVKANSFEGMCIHLYNSEELYWLPPDLRGVKPAPKGTYKLLSTGELVEDPDYTSAWVIESGELPFGGWEREK